MANTQTIQTVVPAELAATAERAAEARGQTLSAFVREILAASLDTTGTFFGVVMCRANSSETADTAKWFAHAVPFRHVDVVDGALVFRQSPGGPVELAIPAGRWRECSRRLEIDRGVFDATKDLDAHRDGYGRNAGPGRRPDRL